jgi:hypothetical protein
MPPSADADRLAHEIRSAVGAASARLQVTARRIERGDLDPDRVLRELRDLDQQVRRVVELIPAPATGDEAGTA